VLLPEIACFVSKLRKVTRKMKLEDILFEACEFLELTDVDLKAVSGGSHSCHNNLYYPDYYTDASSDYDSTSSGFLNIPILSNDNFLNGNSILNIG
jgi:hypothetical protein